MKTILNLVLNFRTLGLDVDRILEMIIVLVLNSRPSNY